MLRRKQAKLALPWTTIQYLSQWMRLYLQLWSQPLTYQLLCQADSNLLTEIFPQRLRRKSKISCYLRMIRWALIHWWNSMRQMTRLRLSNLPRNSCTPTRMKREARAAEIIDLDQKVHSDPTSIKNLYNKATESPSLTLNNPSNNKKQKSI